MLNGLSKKGQVVMVTCTSSGEGKSFISLNLSMSLAIAAKKTVVIGLDLRKPKLTEYLAISNDKPGISEYLQPDSKLQPEDIILKSEKNKDFYFIPSGQEPEDPSELIMGPKMSQLFAYLKEHFDYIVIDTAPIGLVSDAFLLKPYVDMTLYVVRFGQTKIKHLSTIERFYEGRKLNNPTIVFNGVKWDDSQEYRYKNSYYNYSKPESNNDEKTIKKVLNGVNSIF